MYGRVCARQNPETIYYSVSQLDTCPFQKKLTGFAMNTSTPLVSAVIPTCNRAALIGRTIDSVLAQTYPAIELIVIDDGSTDNTDAVIAAFDNPRIRYFRFENRGACTARNSGIEKARGDYIAFIDSDDCWHPKKIAAQVACFQAGAETVGLVYSDTLYIHRSGSVEKRACHRGKIAGQLLVSNVIGSASTGMAPRGVLERIGGFDQSLPARQDIDLWLRIALEYEIDFVSGCPAIIHAEAENRISSNATAVERARYQFFTKHKAAFRTRGGVLEYMKKSAKLIYSLTSDRRRALRFIETAIGEEPTDIRGYWTYLRYYLKFL
jgi:glycosyltransferase involved in cell wall biosynthesis